jgi:uncharacterized protein (DUF1778 family)
MAEETDIHVDLRSYLVGRGNSEHPAYNLIERAADEIKHLRHVQFLMMAACRAAAANIGCRDGEDDLNDAEAFLDAAVALAEKDWRPS